MKQVKFVKDHVAGIKKGETKKMGNSHAERMVKEGYVEIMGELPEEKDEDIDLIGKQKQNKK